MNENKPLQVGKSFDATGSQLPSSLQDILEIPPRSSYPSSHTTFASWPDRYLMLSLASRRPFEMLGWLQTIGSSLKSHFWWRCLKITGSFKKMFEASKNKLSYCSWGILQTYPNTTFHICTPTLVAPLSESLGNRHNVPHYTFHLERTFRVLLILEGSRDHLHIFNNVDLKYSKISWRIVHLPDCPRTKSMRKRSLRDPTLRVLLSLPILRHLMTMV